MTHDFAKKPKPSPKKKSKPRKSQIPGWVWLFTGIVAGVFISFLGYLADIAPEASPEPSHATTTTSKEQPKPKATSTTKFDFYSLLPQREMIVPVEREELNEGKPVQPTIYILQAGSFRNAKDADRLRAQLILMDLDAQVDEVKVANGDLWHRVLVGPFKSRSKLAKARSILISKGIDTLLLKRKAKG